MKINVTIDRNYTEPEIQIYCRAHDGFIERLVARIKSTSLIIIGESEGGKVSVLAEDVFYFETVDKKTFIYQDKDVFESRKKLFELEEYLEGTPFIRISKSCILNSERVVSVDPYYGGRLLATLENNERVIVSKKYTRLFKEKFLESVD